MNIDKSFCTILKTMGHLDVEVELFAMQIQEAVWNNTPMKKSKKNQNITNESIKAYLNDFTDVKSMTIRYGNPLRN